MFGRALGLLCVGTCAAYVWAVVSAILLVQGAPWGCTLLTPVVSTYTFTGVGFFGLRGTYSLCDL